MQNQKLYDAYMSISRKNKEYLQVRDRIIKECKISSHVFYNWIKGITPVPHWAKPRICEVLGIPESVLFKE